MKALRIGATELRRMTRDKTNVFFLFLFPLILIFLIGASFGGRSTPQVGVLAEDQGRFADELVDDLKEDEAIDVTVRSEREVMLEDIERGILEAGVIIPSGYSADLTQGRTSEVQFLSKPGDFAAAVRRAVSSSVEQQAARIRAARVAAAEADAGFDDAYEAAARVGAVFGGTEIVETVAGDRGEFADAGRFDVGASTQLVLFTFVNSLAGSAVLIQTRQYGVLSRMLAAPVSSTTILLGETLGRLFVALIQGVFIIVTTSVLFDVGWGDLYASAAVVSLFALVSTGAAMLAGALLKNDQQAGALVPFGLALAALGGCMVPLEVFPDTMRSIARVTPHSWANEAFHEVIQGGSKIANVLPQLGVLAAFAVGFMVAGSVALGRRLTSP